MAPMLFCWRLLMNVELLNPDVAATPVNNLVKIGSGTVPAAPGAKVVLLLIARFFCALKNSCRDPFSKMLPSF